MKKTTHMEGAPCLGVNVEKNLLYPDLQVIMLMNQGEFFCCKDHVVLSFETVLKDLTKTEFMNVVVRNAKSSKCAIKGCRKTGNFLILFQFFKQKPNKTLQ